MLRRQIWMSRRQPMARPPLPIRSIGTTVKCKICKPAGELRARSHVPQPRRPVIRGQKNLSPIRAERAAGHSALVAAEQSYLHPSGNRPQSQRAVASREDLPSIRAENTTEHHTCITFQHPHGFCPRHIPQPQCPITGAGKRLAPVETEFAAVHLFGMAFKFSHCLAGGHIPQAQRAVARRRERQPPIRTECAGRYLQHVTGQHPQPPRPAAPRRSAGAGLPR